MIDELAESPDEVAEAKGVAGCTPLAHELVADFTHKFGTRWLVKLGRACAPVVTVAKLIQDTGLFIGLFIINNCL